MSVLILVPCLICLYFVARGRVETAFLSVYLPTVLLFPQAFSMRLPHLPDLSMSEIAVVPLGVVAVYRLVQEGRPLFIDFLVSAFILSLSATEVLNENVTKDGIFIALISIISMFLPYAIGRTLIEPGLRMATVRRVVLLALCLVPLGLYEWRMGRNLYAPLGRFFSVDMSPVIQLRGGHGRFSVSFTDSEIAGIAVAMIATLNAWLAYCRRTRIVEDAGRLFSFLAKYHIAEILLVLCVFLTQSRGPQFALIVGYLILQIPRFKNTRVATAVVAVLILAGGIGAYQYFAYTTDLAAAYGVQSEQQGSALYRRRMLELFQPILERGGWMGWGYKSIPHAQGLGNLGNGVQSVDNEFLFVNLAQGRLGLYLLVLIAAESIRSLVMRSWRFESLEDRAFAFSMLAAMAVLWIALTTVYMGDQLPQVAFLFLGWGQSIVAGTAGPIAVQQRRTTSKFLFKRVIY